jgi:tetratricopeptide (TPR) repeat protein
MRLPAHDWIALGVAVAVRVAALYSLEQTAYADFPLVDAHTYWQQAQQLLDGVDPFLDGLYQPPGYPLALAALGQLLGGTLTLAAVRWAQLLLGVATSVGLLLLGRRVGTPLGAPWAGAAAVLLYSLYPSTLLFELDILTPALTSAALVGALLCVMSPAWWPAPLAGALCGMAAVCHPTYLFVAGWLGVWRGGQPAGRRALAGFVVVLAICLAPTTARNIQDTGRPVLVSHNAGLNFYLGNNPRWRETAFLRAGLPFRQLVLDAQPHRRDVAARNAYWWSRSRAEISADPAAWTGALLTKSYWSVHNNETPRNEDYRCRTEEPALAWLRWLPVHYGWVFPLSVLGAVHVLRRRDRAGIALLGSWAALHVPMILFLVADRYRLATWPLVCLLAPIGLVALADLVRQRSRWLAAAAALAVVPWLPTDPVIEKDRARCLHVQGNMAFMIEDFPEARRLYEASLSEDAENMSARMYLASMAHKAGHYDAAAAQMSVVLEHFPDHFPSLKLMSSIQKKRGDLDAAALFMGRAYHVPGDRRASGVRYVLLLLEAGRREEALQAAEADPQLMRDRRVRKAFSEQQ